MPSSPQPPILSPLTPSYTCSHPSPAPSNCQALLRCNTCCRGCKGSLVRPAASAPSSHWWLGTALPAGPSKLHTPTPASQGLLDNPRSKYYRIVGGATPRPPSPFQRVHVHLGQASSFSAASNLCKLGPAQPAGPTQATHTHTHTSYPRACR